MFETEPSEDDKFAARVRKADQTNTLLRAIKALETVKFDAMTGSGIMVKLTPITPGSGLTDEFVMRAEDMGQLAAGMAASLRERLLMRKTLLQDEIKDIDAINKEADKK